MSYYFKLLILILPLYLFGQEGIYEGTYRASVPYSYLYGNDYEDSGDYIEEGYYVIYVDDAGNYTSFFGDEYSTDAIKQTGRLDRNNEFIVKPVHGYKFKVGFDGDRPYAIDYQTGIEIDNFTQLGNSFEDSESASYLLNDISSGAIRPYHYRPLRSDTTDNYVEYPLTYKDELIALSGLWNISRTNVSHNYENYIGKLSLSGDYIITPNFIYLYSIASAAGETIKALTRVSPAGDFSSVYVDDISWDYDLRTLSVSGGGSEYVNGYYIDIDLDLTVKQTKSFYDSDVDGLSNYKELSIGTKTSKSDSDGDRVSDFEEFNIGTDPLDRTDKPLTITVNVSTAKGLENDSLLGFITFEEANSDFELYESDNYKQFSFRNGKGSSKIFLKKDTEYFIVADNEYYEYYLESYYENEEPLILDSGIRSFSFSKNSSVNLVLDIDIDEDGLTNSVELSIGTDPNNYDSDGDYLSDGYEVSINTDPRSVDSDGDGDNDYLENTTLGTDPLNANSNKKSLLQRTDYLNLSSTDAGYIRGDKIHIRSHGGSNESGDSYTDFESTKDLSFDESWVLKAKVTNKADVENGGYFFDEEGDKESRNQVAAWVSLFNQVKLNTEDESNSFEPKILVLNDSNHNYSFFSSKISEVYGSSNVTISDYTAIPNHDLSLYNLVIIAGHGRNVESNYNRYDFPLPDNLHNWIMNGGTLFVNDDTNSDFSLYDLLNIQKHKVESNAEILSEEIYSGTFGDLPNTGWQGDSFGHNIVVSASNENMDFISLVEDGEDNSIVAQLEYGEGNLIFCGMVGVDFQSNSAGSSEVLWLNLIDYSLNSSSFRDEYNSYDSVELVELVLENNNGDLAVLVDQEFLDDQEISISSNSEEVYFKFVYDQDSEKLSYHYSYDDADYTQINAMSVDGNELANPKIRFGGDARNVVVSGHEVYISEMSFSDADWEMYDDFSSGTIDAKKWDYAYWSGGAKPYISEGKLILSANGSTANYPSRLDDYATSILRFKDKGIKAVKYDLNIVKLSEGDVVSLSGNNFSSDFTGREGIPFWNVFSADAFSSNFIASRDTGISSSSNDLNEGSNTISCFIDNFKNESNNLSYVSEHQDMSDYQGSVSFAINGTYVESYDDSIYGTARELMFYATSTRDSEELFEVTIDNVMVLRDDETEAEYRTSLNNLTLANNRHGDDVILSFGRNEIKGGYKNSLLGSVAITPFSPDKNVFVIGFEEYQSQNELSEMDAYEAEYDFTEIVFTGKNKGYISNYEMEYTSDYHHDEDHGDDYDESHEDEYDEYHGDVYYEEYEDEYDEEYGYYFLDLDSRYSFEVVNNRLILNTDWEMDENFANDNELSNWAYFSESGEVELEISEGAFFKFQEPTTDSASHREIELYNLAPLPLANESWELSTNLINDIDVSLSPSYNRPSVELDFSTELTPGSKIGDTWFDFGVTLRENWDTYSYVQAEPHTDRNNNWEWDEAESFTDTNANGIYDIGESFVDLGNGQYDTAEWYNDENNNAQYDLGESYDDNNYNDIWDDAEEFVDINGDGYRDWDEPYTDLSNGIWDDAESFTDENGNGIYDGQSNKSKDLLLEVTFDSDSIADDDSHYDSRPIVLIPLATDTEVDEYGMLQHVSNEIPSNVYAKVRYESGQDKIYIEYSVDNESWEIGAILDLSNGLVDSDYLTRPYDYPEELNLLNSLGGYNLAPRGKELLVFEIEAQSMSSTSAGDLGIEFLKIDKLKDLPIQINFAGGRNISNYDEVQIAINDEVHSELEIDSRGNGKGTITVPSKGEYTLTAFTHDGYKGSPATIDLSSSRLVMFTLDGDTDGDGVTDSVEAKLRSDPNNSDSDGDGLEDAYEYEIGTSLILADTDKDGYDDYMEHMLSTNPNNSRDKPIAFKEREFFTPSDWEEGFSLYAYFNGLDENNEFGYIEMGFTGEMLAEKLSAIAGKRMTSAKLFLRRDTTGSNPRWFVRNDYDEIEVSNYIQKIKNESKYLDASIVSEDFDTKLTENSEGGFLVSELFTINASSKTEGSISLVLSGQHTYVHTSVDYGGTQIKLPLAMQDSFIVVGSMEDKNLSDGKILIEGYIFLGSEELNMFGETFNPGGEYHEEY